jgi:uncharacterized membrane protein
MASPAYSIFGPLDAVIGGSQTMAYVLLGLVLFNIVTRIVSYRHFVSEAERIQESDAEDSVDSLRPHPIHIASNVLLLLGAFYYTSLDQHTGIVVTTLVLGVFITDFFEVESQRVDVRRDLDVEPPKGTIAASLLTLLYVGYLSLFQFVEPLWSAIV